MKFIIIGLGHFGSSLAEKLTLMGHEVIGADKEMVKVDAIKEKITHAICLNCKNAEAIKNLPLKNTDVVVGCIGESEGENIMTTALLKKSGVKRLISRVVSPLQQDVLEAMGITEFVQPEIEGAGRWAIKLSTPGVLNLFEVTDEHAMAEVEIPKRFIGQTIGQIGLNTKFNVIVLTKLNSAKEKHIMGLGAHVFRSGEIVTAKTVLMNNDVLVVYGHKDDIRSMLEAQE